MEHHFSSSSMRSLAEDMAAGYKSRTNFANGIRTKAKAMLTSFRREHAKMATDLHRVLTDNRRTRLQHEKERQQKMDPLVANRKLFVSELKSDVNAFLKRARIARGELAADIRAASDAWQNRTKYGHQPKTVLKKSQMPEPEKADSRSGFEPYDFSKPDQGTKKKPKRSN